MAGSYSHIHSQSLGDGRGINLIENLADAGQCIEELYFLVRMLGTDEEIKKALDEFHRFKRREAFPDEAGASFRLEHFQAWTESQLMMGR